MLRAIFESSTDFAIFAVNRKGTVISWNVGAERLTGFAETEIIGRDGDIIFTPEDRAAGAPEQERQTARAVGRAEDDRWHQRKNGSRFWSSGLLMPLRDNVEGFVKILRDRTAHHRVEQELRESEARFRMLATSIPQLVFRSRNTGERTWGSPQWEVFTGLSDPASRDFGWLDAIHPEDRDATVTGWRLAQRTGDYHVEHRVRRATDGEYRWHQTRATPVQAGGAVGDEWVGTSTDIHELRGLQERQQVLLAELHHRTRNLLALVQAIASQILRSRPSLEAFAAQFKDRLRALSRVQGLLARTDRKTIDLRSILDAELAAHEEDHGSEQRSKMQVAGPSVQLPPSSAQTLALAVHELATNAAKYGALSQPDGQLQVTWRLEDQADKCCLILDWRESGVTMPAEKVPKRKGYGSELIERALPYQLKAKTRLDFGEDGVRCLIAVPIAPAEEDTVHG
jgi:PAS domain S-box-containing protein